MAIDIDRVDGLIGAVVDRYSLKEMISIVMRGGHGVLIVNQRLLGTMNKIIESI